MKSKAKQNNAMQSNGKQSEEKQWETKQCKRNNAFNKNANFNLLYIWGRVGFITWIFDHWHYFGSAGGTLLILQGGLGHQRCPRRRHPPQIKSLFVATDSGVVFLHILWFVGLCFPASFFVELRGPFLQDLGCVLTSFQYFLTLDRASGFNDILNHSIRKLVIWRSEGIDFQAFSTCFVDFVLSVVFC